MTPYYQDDLVTLYHGDCLTIRDWCAADVLVTDPPYGTQFTAGNPRGGYGRRQDSTGRGSRHAPATPGMGAWIPNDATTDTRDRALGMWGDRPALVFGSPRMPDPPMAVVDRLVWDKKRPGMNGGPWRYRHESIYVTAGFERRSNDSVSILTAYPDQADHIHAKPVGLMERLIDCAPPGSIADPFAGAGSTIIAARRLGRRVVAVEIEERYCETIALRLAQGVLS